MNVKPVDARPRPGTPVFRLRLTKQERGLLEQAAERRALTISEFVRSAALAEAAAALLKVEGEDGAKKRRRSS
jgi:uncharacterized protein (DUF1778 family)